MECKEVYVRAKIPGYLTDIPVEEGQEVKEGDLLFSTDRRDVEVKQTQASATAKAAAGQVEAAKNAAEAAAARKAAEEAAETQVPDGKTQRLPDDIMELVDQLESRVAKAEEEDPEDLFDVEEELELASTAKADFEDEDFEDDFDEADFEEEDFNEDDFEEEDFDEDDFDEEDFDEEDFDEDEYEDDFGEEDPEEAEYEDEEDFEEEDFEEEDFEDDSFEEADFDDEDFFDDDDDEEDDEKPAQEDLEIEEPSEEEIQDRIKKSKGGGVPFDTGFVVTGRYDLSATSEIGLKRGLRKSRKKKRRNTRTIIIMRVVKWMNMVSVLLCIIVVRLLISINSIVLYQPDGVVISFVQKESVISAIIVICLFFLSRLVCRKS